jgi:hypothetical protein
MRCCCAFSSTNADQGKAMISGAWANDGGAEKNEYMKQEITT